MPKPTFSIILSTYNRASLLARTIDSILQQTFSSYELLVVDDASTDSTSEVVDSFKTPQLRYLPQDTNRGVGHVRNVGIVHAKGEYIVFVDDDDTIAPEFLEEVHNLIQKLPSSCGFIWTWKQIGRLNGDNWEVLRTITYGFQDSQLQSGHRFFDKLTGGSGGLIVRADCLAAVGGFDEAFRALGDTELLIRLASCYDYAVIPKPLYRISILEGIQLTKPGIARAQANEQLIKKHYTLLKQRPHLLAERYRVSAKMYFGARDTANGRRMMRKLQRFHPFSIKFYGLWIALEMFEWLPTKLQNRLLPVRR